ncbi:MAG TPA: hypothetical protein VIV12_05940, partial [Streptosporangiaceae bacterium]
ASDLGFDVTFVTDATATFPIPHRDAPTGRTVAEIVADPLTGPGGWVRGWPDAASATRPAGQLRRVRGG